MKEWMKRNLLGVCILFNLMAGLSYYVEFYAEKVEPSAEEEVQK